MKFIAGNNRHQSFFSTLEEPVSADNAVRIVDAFIDKLDLEKMVFLKQYKRAKGYKTVVITIISIIKLS